ncbi:MAG TPA: glycosyltransferase family 4 protein [Spongiibacteraceae bacterium]|nr:glycosyltransferase family 4 protein [Spongiibacteraceae bacterium]
MKILFLSHYFPPEVNAPATRTYEHCRRWVELGHEVTVISCVPHHPMGKAYPGYRNRLIQTENKDGIRAIKVLTYITANEGFFKRTLNYVFYMLMTIVVAPFLPRADIVISTSPQFFNGLAGFFVSRIKRCAWILEIRDLWPESILAVGAIKNPYIIKLLENIERFVYRKADHIVPVTYSFRRHIIAHGGRDEDISVIRNGVDLQFFEPRAEDTDYARQLGIEGKFVAAYVGTHGMAHGLDLLVEAAERLTHRTDIAILLAGDGAERTRLEQEIKRRNLTNIQLLGQLPKTDMPRLWSITNVSLVVLKKLDLFLTVIPSKLFESMAMRRPIILGVAGESAELLQESGAGIGIEPGNVDQLVAAIVRLADSPELCTELGAQGRSYVETHFNRRVLADRFEQLLTTVSHKLLNNKSGRRA